MKRISILPILLAASGAIHAQSACGAGAVYCTPIQAYGRLQAKSVGGKGGIYDSSGTRQVVLRGMSMYWSSEPAGYQFFNPSVVQWLQKDWLVSVIRVPLAVEKAPNSASTNKGYVDDSGVTTNRVLAVVNSAIAQGLYVIIDWHCYDQVHEDKAGPFFRTMAAKYKNVPNVMFEIWNEPISGDVSGYAGRILKIIRETGNKNLVIVGSAQWSSQPNSVSAPTDPANNIAYTLHFYSSEGSHSGYVNNNMTQAIGAGRAVFITEWGATSADGKSNYSWPTNLLNTVESNKVSSCNWNIGNPLFDPASSTSTTVEASAALTRSANSTGSWTTDMLTQDGKDAKAWLTQKNAGMFTLPDTSLKVLEPMASDSDTISLGGSTTFRVTLSKSASLAVKLTGATSGAYWTTTASGDDITIPWSTTKKALASVAFQAGETVNLTVTNTSLGGLATKVVIRKGTSVRERVAQASVIAWTSQGLRLPASAVASGETYQIRLLDLDGRQVGESRSATARPTGNEAVLDLPAVRGHGVAIVELRGSKGSVLRAVLPPVRD